jgi:hypothetical protein
MFVCRVKQEADSTFKEVKEDRCNNVG